MFGDCSYMYARYISRSKEVRTDTPAMMAGSEL